LGISSKSSLKTNMKKKLLVLLIAAIPMLMPNLASAIAIDVEDCSILARACPWGDDGD
jgi:hypothetical protein